MSNFKHVQELMIFKALISITNIHLQRFLNKFNKTKENVNK